MADADARRPSLDEFTREIEAAIREAGQPFELWASQGAFGYSLNGSGRGAKRGEAIAEAGAWHRTTGRQSDSAL
jgi:hypothetical protein